MAKPIKIKDIAQRAGVSVGTVDRILHNRGSVSPARRQAVEEVLAESGYRTNLHTSAVSITREYRLAIIIPAALGGEYWGNVYDGIQRALAEYSDLKLVCNYIYYNQFDLYSCRSIPGEVARLKPDAALIGPTFADETLALCHDLESQQIPYVFVDSVIEGAHPIATFSTSQYDCGRLLAKLLTLITPADAGYAVFHNQRIGNTSANNSVARMRGFQDYMRENKAGCLVHPVALSMLEPDRNEQIVTDFLTSHPEVRGAVMLNSRGYVLAELLGRRAVRDIRFVCFDLTRNNLRELRNGNIDFLLCQHPEMQGFFAIRELIRYLVYREVQTPETFLPIDIVTRENVDYYRDVLVD